MEKAQKCRQTTNVFVGGWVGVGVGGQVVVVVGGGVMGVNQPAKSGRRYKGDGSLICRLPLLHEW